MSTTQLRPRFLPDREAAREWGSKGAPLARMIRKGFAVPPTAAMGLTQVRQWLEGLPEFTPAIESGSAESLSKLVQAVVDAPMPEHWVLSTATLRKFLCGDTDENATESWPMLLRGSLEGAGEGVFEFVLVHDTSPEELWKGFARVVASVFRSTSLELLARKGLRLRDLRMGVVIQPHLLSELTGTAFSRDGVVEWTDSQGKKQNRTFAEGATDSVLAPFWEHLLKRTRQAEKIVGGSAALEWLWDGSQLWFLQLRPVIGSRLVRMNRESGEIKTLLVDLDGTLLGAYESVARVEFIIRALLGIRHYRGFGAAVRALRAMMKALEHPTAEEMRQLNVERAAVSFGRELGLGPVDADRVLREQIATIFPKLKRYFFPVAGAKEFIEWARPRYKLILATNPVWPLEQVHLRLRWAGIDPSVFDSITHADRMHACKPREAYYQELLDQERLKAGECALVGDDVTNDLPATRVGIPVFILSRKPLVLIDGDSGTFADFVCLLRPHGDALSGAGLELV